MAYFIDYLINQKAEINGRWYIARPKLPPLWWRIRDAWGVITGRYDAVWFKDKTNKQNESLEKEDTKIVRCIDCIHCYIVNYLTMNAICVHPKLISLVDGKPRNTCESLRLSKCGEQARYFEPIK